MTKEQEEAIEIIDKMIKSYIEADECGLSNNDFKHEIKAMQTVLNMLKEKDNLINEQLKENVKLQKELNEENKRCMILANNDKFKEQIIDLILDKINENYNNTFNSDEVKEIIEIYENIKNENKLKGLELRKDCIKQFFERKVEKGE